MLLDKSIVLIFVLCFSKQLSFSQIKKDSLFNYKIEHTTKKIFEVIDQQIYLSGIIFNESNSNYPPKILFDILGGYEESGVVFSTFRDSIQGTCWRTQKKTFLEAPYNKSKIWKVGKLLNHPDYSNFSFRIDYAWLIEQFENISYPIIGTDTILTRFRFHDLRFSNIQIFSDSVIEIDMWEATGKKLKISNLDKRSSVYLTKIIVDTFYLMDLKSLPAIVYDSIKASYLSLSKMQLDKDLNFSGLQIPEFLELNNLSFTGSVNKIDLTTFRYGDSSKCKLRLKDFDFTKLKLNYQYFDLYFPVDSSDREEVSYDAKENIYKCLLDEQKKEGYSRGFEKLEKEFKKLAYTHDNSWLGKFQNALDKWWWDYGYNKKLIVLRAFEIMLFFFLINLFFYTKLIYSAYTINEFIHADQMLTDKYGRTWKRIPFKFLYCLLYTGYLFWGIRIDFEKVKLQNLLLVSWIFIQYISGIICLAWIANFIVTR